MAYTAVVVAFFAIAILIFVAAFAHPNDEYCDDPSCPCHSAELDALLDEQDEQDKQGN